MKAAFSFFGSEGERRDMRTDGYGETTFGVGCGRSLRPL